MMLDEIQVGTKFEFTDDIIKASFTNLSDREIEQLPDYSTKGGVISKKTVFDTIYFITLTPTDFKKYLSGDWTNLPLLQIQFFQLDKERAKLRYKIKPFNYITAEITIDNNTGGLEVKDIIGRSMGGTNSNDVLWASEGDNVYRIVNINNTNGIFINWNNLPWDGEK